MIVTRGYGSNSLIVTRGYGIAVYIEPIISILPQFITRRAAVTKIIQRISISRVVRREDD
jgi:hypothetical protein